MNTERFEIVLKIIFQRNDFSTGSQFFTTGNIGEAILVGTPIFGSGSNLGSNPSAVADFVSLYNSLILLTGTTIITPSNLGSDNYGNGVG